MTKKHLNKLCKTETLTDAKATIEKLKNMLIDLMSTIKIYRQIEKIKERK